MQRDQREDLAHGADRDRLGHTQPALDPRRPAEADADADPGARPHAEPDSQPEPTPTPAPTGGTCSLPASNTPDAPCAMGSNSFLGQVDKAITLLTQQQPEIFDFNSKNCENCYYVKNQAKFTAGVIRNLNAVGLCATYDGEELGVKNSNSFNDQFDLLVSSGHIRRGEGSYRSTCRPSWF